MLFGVISFPGTNCETESVRALQKAGIDAKVFLWNEPLESLNDCDGFLLAGGFSYEDRGRSGVVAANNPIIPFLSQASKQGKLILGICNGAQILVESGLITDSEKPHIALSLNKRVKNGKVQGIGFYHSWCSLKNNAKQGRSAFNNFSNILRMPLAHAEGRFIIEETLLKDMQKHDQIIFTYTDDKGNTDESYPTNPNGSYKNIAGVCNKNGNVVAMMPHPERAGVLSEDLFTGISSWVASSSIKNPIQIHNTISPDITQKKTQKDHIEFFIESIITDNTCETIRLSLEQKTQQKIALKRYRYFAIQPQLTSKSLLTQALSIVQTDELANANKEMIYIKIDNEFYLFSKTSGFQKIENQSFLQKEETCFIAEENEDLLASVKLQKLKHEKIDIKTISSAIIWASHKKNQNAIIESGILANPISMQLSFYNS
jgi:phosphoribosylformylglycinamidine synthase subunit PurQ / glutaminase